MATPTTPVRVSVHDLVGDELADYIARHKQRFGIPPLAGGAEGEGEGSAEGEGSGEGAAEGSGEGEGSNAGEGESQGKSEPDWKVEARKHERRAKAVAKENEALKAKQAQLDEQNKTETQKAIDKAREEGKTEALTAAQKERRADRLEVAVTRLSSKTFADSEDALVQIERAIAKGDLDEDDIFDDQGKVQTEALKSALEDLLERKPHLAADTSGRQGRIKGSSGAGQGSGSGKGLDELSVEEHLDRQRRHK